MQNEINPLIYTKNEYDSTKEYCGKECTILPHSMVGSKGYVHPPPCCYRFAIKTHGNPLGGYHKGLTIRGNNATWTYFEIQSFTQEITL